MHQCESTSIYELWGKRLLWQKHDKWTNTWQFGRPEHSMTRASYRAVSSNMLHTVKPKCLSGPSPPMLLPTWKTWGYSQVSKSSSDNLRKKSEFNHQKIAIVFQGICHYISRYRFNWITRIWGFRACLYWWRIWTFNYSGGIFTSAPDACSLPCVPTTEFPNFFGLIEVESVPQTQPKNWSQRVLIRHGPLNYLPVEEHICSRFRVVYTCTWTSHDLYMIDYDRIGSVDIDDLLFREWSGNCQS